MKRNFGKILLFASVLTLIDQVSKYLVQKSTIDYVKNVGIAFGIKIPFILILTLIFIPIIIYIACKELDLNNKITKISVGLILAGALGNVIDRITNGFVIDFISVPFWPSFNFADIYISVGVLMIVIFYGRIKVTKK